MRHKLFPFFAICLTLLTSCGSSDDQSSDSFSGTSRWESLPVPLYADPKITQDPYANQDLQDAMSFWETKVGKPLFTYLGTWQQSGAFAGPAEDPEQIFGNIIWMQSPWPFGMNIVGKTHINIRNHKFENSLILLDQAANYCSGDCAQLPNSISRRKLIAHELGHFIGLDHVNNADNIMYPAITSGGDLSTMQVDNAALLKLTN